MSVTARAKNQILKVLYDRVMVGRQSRFTTASTIRKSLPEPFSSQFLGVMLDSLENTGYVLHADVGRYSISDAGIDLVDSGWQYAEDDVNIVDHWDQPDNTKVLSVSALESVRFHLAQCILLVNASDFSQQEKAQIAGLVRICEQIVDLPTPKLGLLKRILGWLKDVKDLVPLIEAVLKLLGKS